MPRKVFQVQVEMDVHAVSCPGVWLCPNGQLSLQIYLLESCVQTLSVDPVFPLYFSEKFLFYKIFDKAQRLSDLQRFLGKEILYAELIQWTDKEIGNVLATFTSSLCDVLFPAKNVGVHSGVDVDLLMEPTKSFPGIIAPKIEMSTITSIEESVCTKHHRKCSAFVVNPKTVTSDGPLRGKGGNARQKKVCHSIGYHRSRRCRDGAQAGARGRPPFLYRKADKDMLSRKPQGLDGGEGCSCRCGRSRSEGASWGLSPRTYTDLTDEFIKTYEKTRKREKRGLQKGKTCPCGRAHSERSCPVCTRYNDFFDETPRDNPPIKSYTSSPHKCPCCSRKPYPITKVELVEIPQRSDSGSLCCEILQESRRNKPSCQCSPHSKKSVAESIHRKLSDSVNGCSSEGMVQDLSPSPVTSYVCPVIYTTSNYRKRFYDSLEKFYEKLYRRAQEKARNVTSIDLCTC